MISLVIRKNNSYDLVMVNTQEVLYLIKNTQSPLTRQLLMVGFITKLLEEQGKTSPSIRGGCALSYYSREVYFTADIDHKSVKKKYMFEGRFESP